VIGPEIAIAVGTALFWAGGGWFLLRSLRKDLNGVRGVINRIDAREEKRHKLLVATFYRSKDAAIQAAAEELLTES